MEDEDPIAEDKDDIEEEDEDRDDLCPGCFEPDCFGECRDEDNEYD